MQKTEGGCLMALRCCKIHDAADLTFEEMALRVRMTPSGPTRDMWSKRLIDANEACLVAVERPDGSIHVRMVG